jgi:hypothetical protein
MTNIALYFYINIAYQQFTPKKKKYNVHREWSKEVLGESNRKIIHK